MAGVVAGFDSTPSPALGGVGLTLQYYEVFPNGSSDLLNGLPNWAGNFEVTASFAGSIEYAATTTAPVPFTISQAIPTLQVSAVSGSFNGQPMAVTATVAGVDNSPAASLEGVGLTLQY